MTTETKPQTAAEGLELMISDLKTYFEEGNTLGYGAYEKLNGAPNCAYGVLAGFGGWKGYSENGFRSRYAAIESRYDGAAEYIQSNVVVNDNARAGRHAKVLSFLDTKHAKAVDGALNT